MLACSLAPRTTTLLGIAAYVMEPARMSAASASEDAPHAAPRTFPEEQGGCCGGHLLVEPTRTRVDTGRSAPP